MSDSSFIILYKCLPLTRFERHRNLSGNRVTERVRRCGEKVDLSRVVHELCLLATIRSSQYIHLSAV